MGPMATAGPDALADSAAMASVLTALSSLIDGFEFFPEIAANLRPDVLRHLGSLSRMSSEFIIPGEVPGPYITANFQVQPYRSFLRDASPFPMPQSAFERIVAVPDDDPGWVDVLDAKGDAGKAYGPETTLGISLVRYPRPQLAFNLSSSNWSLVGIQISLSLAATSATPAGGDWPTSLSLDISLVLPAPVPYSAQDYRVFSRGSETHTAFCQRTKKRLPYNLTLSCEDVYGGETNSSIEDSHFLYTCSGHVSGRYEFNCSTESRVPTCIPFDTDWTQPSTGSKCKVLSFSSRNTTCRCEGQPFQHLLSHVVYDFKPFSHRFLPARVFVPPQRSMWVLVGIAVGIFSALLLVCFRFFEAKWKVTSYLIFTKLRIIISYSPYRQVTRERKLSSRHTLRDTTSLFNSYDQVIKAAFPNALFEAGSSHISRYVSQMQANHPLLRHQQQDPALSATYCHALFFKFTSVLFNSMHLLTHASLAVVLTQLTAFDDGTCEELTEEKACSDFQLFENKYYCRWSEFYHTCSYEASEETYRDTVLFAVVVILISQPIMQLIHGLGSTLEYLFARRYANPRILSAVTVTEDAWKYASDIEGQYSEANGLRSERGSGDKESLSLDVRLKFLLAGLYPYFVSSYHNMIPYLHPSHTNILYHHPVAKMDMMRRKLDEVPVLDQLMYFLKHNRNLCCEHVVEVFQQRRRGDLNICVYMGRAMMQLMGKPAATATAAAFTPVVFIYCLIKLATPPQSK